MKRKHQILLAVATGLVLLSAGHSYTNRPLPFDEPAWKAGETAAFDSRAPWLRMADGLVESETLKGKAKVAVLAMLGPPTETDKFKDYALVYWLGAERGFIGIDSEWLVVNFDKSGTVSEVSIVRD